VERALPEAQAMARRMAWRCSALEQDELVAVGKAVLVAQVQRFDPARGVSLAQFARKGMRGAMLRASKKQVRTRLGGAWQAVLTHEEAVEESVDLAAELMETEGEHRDRALALGASAALVAFLAYKGKSHQPSPEDELSLHQERALLRRSIEDLGDSAALIDLLYFQDLDWESAAARLGMSVSSAQRLENKLIPRLRAALVAKGVLPEVA
jgi:RNA polymerase sigma factor (sigma-70 family)